MVVPYLILQRGPPPRAGTGGERGRQFFSEKNPPLSTPFPVLGSQPLVSSDCYRHSMVPRCTYQLKDALIPLHTSLSVIYGQVTNYPKLNDIKQPPVFFSLCILQVRSLEKAWGDWEDLKGRGWSHLETSWFTNAWCLCRVGLSHDC